MTTSRTTRTKARRRRGDAPGGRHGDIPAAKPPRARRGFTLLEILLAVAVLVLLAAMAAVNFPAMRGSRTLEDGADRLATGLRMAWVVCGSTVAARERITPYNSACYVSVAGGGHLAKDTAIKLYARQSSGDALDVEHARLSVARL